jgi:hypothetical protein
VFTPFHKPPYPYPYGRSVDETTTPIVAANAPTYTQKCNALGIKHPDTKVRKKNSKLSHYTHTNITSKADQNHLRPKDLNSDARRKTRRPLEAT